MARARILEATRHEGGGGADVRLVVQFATDAGDPLGTRTIDVPSGSTQAEARALIQAEFQAIANATVAGLVGSTWQW